MNLFYWYEMRQSEKLGIAIVCGAISQNLEVVDFDNAKIVKICHFALFSSGSSKIPPIVE